MIKYIVVGTARCGTGYMSKMLSKYVGPCGHEALFTPYTTKADVPGILAKPYLKAESSWLAAPFLDQLVKAGVRIVHITRQPRQVMSSLINRDFYKSIRALKEPQCNHKYPKQFSQFAVTHVPALADMNDVDAAATWYVEWNQKILKFSKHPRYVHVRLEDMPLAFYKTFNIKGVNDPEDLRPQNVGINPTELSVEAMVSSPVYPRLKEIAAIFGYTV